MTKLYELMSEPIGVTFKITVGDVTKELTLGRFTLAKMIAYEKKKLPIDTLMQKMQEEPGTYATMVGWDLLVEKDEFDNSIDIFINCLGSLQSLNTLGEALTATILDSKPVGKKSEGAKTTKK